MSSPGDGPGLPKGDGGHVLHIRPKNKRHEPPLRGERFLPLWLYVKVIDEVDKDYAFG